MKRLSRFLPLALAILALVPQPAWACAACFGKSDSPAAVAMNWAIGFLLMVIVGVLGSIGYFIYYLNKRSSLS